MKSGLSKSLFILYLIVLVTGMWVIIRHQKPKEWLVMQVDSQNCAKGMDGMDGMDGPPLGEKSDLSHISIPGPSPLYSDNDQPERKSMPVHLTKANGNPTVINAKFVVSVEPSKRDPDVTYVQTTAGMIEIKGKYESICKKLRFTPDHGDNGSLEEGSQNGSAARPERKRATR